MRFEQRRLRRNAGRWLALTVVLSMLVAACGSSSDGESAAEATTEEGTTDITQGPNPDAPAIDCEPITDDLGEFTLKLGHVAPPMSHFGLPADFLADYVEECTNGQVTVEVFPLAQLGGELDLLDGLQTGTVELALVTASPTMSVVSELALLELPFFFPDYDAVDRVLDGEVGDELLARFEGTGITALSWGEIGFRYLTTRNARVESPEDLRGLNIRVTENEVHVDTWRALGASPTTMPIPEVYSALEQGVIDGQENPWLGNVTFNFWEVSAYGTDTRHAFTAALFLAGDSAYDALPSAYQDVLRQGAQLATDYNRAIVRAFEDWSREQFGKLGPEVVLLDDEQREEFRAATEALHESWAPRIGRDLYDRAVDVIGR